VLLAAPVLQGKVAEAADAAAVTPTPFSPGSTPTATAKSPKLNFLTE
jgi:hypothetical protein